MKKILLLSILLSQLIIGFGQQRDDVGHRVTAWSTQRYECFKGLEWRVRKSYYSDDSPKYINEIEIKNTYSSTITFSFEVSENPDPVLTQFRKTLSPGQSSSIRRVQNADYVYLYVKDVCFNSNNRCDNTCYALCDNGTPNIPKDCGGNSSNNTGSSSNNNNNTTTTPQNDPTFDRNNASFQDYYKRATSAGQAGNYDEAIDLWNKAISVAVNDDQRNNARAWLAEAQKAKGNTDLQRQNDDQLRRQEQIRQNELQQENERKQKERQALVNVGVQLVNVGIELFSKHKETEPKFNGDLTTFIKSNLKCPALTIQNVSVKVNLSIDDNGKLNDDLCFYTTEYEGPNSNDFENEIKRIIKLTRGMWIPAKYDGENNIGKYKFTVNFECRNNSVVTKLSDNYKTKNKLEEEYKNYFLNYSKEFKYLNSRDSNNTYIINFNFFTIEIPLIDGKPENYSIIKYTKDGFLIIEALKSNNNLYSRDISSFYISNDNNFLNFKRECLVNSKSDLSNSEKTKNTKLIFNAIKKVRFNAFHDNKPEISYSLLKELKLYLDNDTYASGSTLGFDGKCTGYGYKYEFYESLGHDYKIANFYFYFKDSYEYFKNSIDLNYKNVSVFEDSQNKMKIQFVIK